MSVLENYFLQLVQPRILSSLMQSSYRTDAYEAKMTKLMNTSAWILPCYGYSKLFCQVEKCISAYHYSKQNTVIHKLKITLL